MSSLFVYLTIRFSTKHNLYDSVNSRKIHSGNIPRLGGIGFFSAYFISSFILYLRFSHLRIADPEVYYVIAGCFLIFIMGILDDLKNLKAIIKLSFQILAACLVLYSGLMFSELNFSAIGFNLKLGYFAYPLTLLWIVGITNAINLMDGIDGQAGCLGGSIILGYVFIFLNLNINILLIYTSLILVFTIAGFLLFNLAKPNAKIFMGDVGAQTLGFIIAILPLIQNNENIETIPFHFAIAFSMLPILDTIAAVWRRLRDKKPIGEGDRFHLHHKLMLVGFSARRALVIFMVFQIIINILTIAAVLSKGFHSMLILLAILFLGILLFAILHFKKEKIVNYGQL